MLLLSRRRILPRNPLPSQENPQLRYSERLLLVPGTGFICVPLFFPHSVVPFFLLSPVGLLMVFYVCVCACVCMCVHDLSCV